MDLAGGVDFGGSSAKIGLVDRQGRLQARETIAIDSRLPFESIIAPVTAGLVRLCEGLPGARLAGVGICTPGFIDTKGGVILEGCENLPGLRGMPLAAAFCRATGAPSFVDNDATVAAAGELLFGAGRAFRNFVLVTLGTGVGGGLVLDGRVFRGSRGFAAEIGHVCVDPLGVWCNCGSRGCLEQYASGPAIVRLYSEKLAKRGVLGPREDLTPRLVAQAAAAGDPVARDALEDAAGFLAQVLGSVLNLLDVEAFIFGGGVSSAGEVLLAPVRRRLPDYTWPLVLQGVQVIPAGLSNDAGVLGAAAQAFERLERQ
jgi:glucokinase